MAHNCIPPSFHITIAMLLPNRSSIPHHPHSQIYIRPAHDPSGPKPLDDIPHDSRVRAIASSRGRITAIPTGGWGIVAVAAALERRRYTVTVGAITTSGRRGGSVISVAAGGRRIVTVAASGRGIGAVIDWSGGHDGNQSERGEDDELHVVGQINAIKCVCGFERGGIAIESVFALEI